MKHIRFMLLLLVIGMLNVAVSPLLSQSLRQTIGIALKENPQVRAQQEILQQYLLEKKSVFRSTLPKLDFDASYRHVTEVPEIEFPAGGPFPGGSVQIGALDTYETGISLNYVLFSGFAQTSQLRMKETEAAVAREKLQQTEKETAFRTISAYRAVQLQAININILQSAQKRAGLQLKRVRNLTRQGMALALDTLSLALAKLDFEQQIISARAELETAADRLADVVGRGIAVAGFQQPLPSADDLNFNRQGISELRLIDLQKDIMQSGRGMVKAGLYPKIAAYASYKFGRPGLDIIQNEWMQYGVWGVGVSWNLFSWGTDRLKIEAREAGIRSINWQESSLNSRFETRYKNARRELQSLREQQKVLAAALDLARQKMAIVESQYNQGMASATDYNNANLELSEAELKFKAHQLRVSLKLSEVEYVSGKPIKAWSIE